MSGPLEFLVGESIILAVAVSEPIKRAPVDVTSVVLTSMTLVGVNIPVLTTVFTHGLLGQYTLLIPSVGLAAGVYKVIIAITGTLDAVSGVTILSDSFVLRAV